MRLQPNRKLLTSRPNIRRFCTAVMQCTLKYIMNVKQPNVEQQSVWQILNILSKLLDTKPITHYVYVFTFTSVTSQIQLEVATFCISLKNVVVGLYQVFLPVMFILTDCVQRLVFEMAYLYNFLFLYRLWT